MKDQDAAYLAISDAMPSFARQPERMMVSYPSAQEERDAARAALQADVAAFLAAGGTITVEPYGKSGISEG